MPEEDEFRAALAEVEAKRPDLIEPNAEEARNGWTAEALTAYLHEQTAAQEVRIDPQSTSRRRARRPRQANNNYNPQRWRG